MNDFNTDALVIRTLPSGDSDRLITLLTAGRGRINVMAKGARSLKSRYMPACAPFVYGNYEIRAKTAAEKTLVKRVIAVGGQEVVIDTNTKTITVDGVEYADAHRYLKDYNGDYLRSSFAYDFDYSTGIFKTTVFGEF